MNIKEHKAKLNLEWQRNNRDKCHAYSKKWYEKNKESNAKRSKKWAENNKERIVEIVQAYVKRNKKKVTVYNNRFGKTIEGRYRLLKYRHHKRWEDEFITLQDYEKIFNKQCTYCGGIINGGVDRIDNSLGYTKENSAPCCKTCNYMKKDLNIEKFISHIKKIYEYNK